MNTYTIPLRNSKPESQPTLFAIIDEDDFQKVAHLQWNATKRTAFDLSDTFVASLEKSGKRVFMHRVIMGDPKGFKVRHKNCNGLDNRKENLELIPQ